MRLSGDARRRCDQGGRPIHDFGHARVAIWAVVPTSEASVESGCRASLRWLAMTSVFETTASIGLAPPPSRSVRSMVPGLVLAAALSVAAVIGVVRSGLPDFAWPLALPMFATALLAVAAAWICSRQSSTWWVPVIALVLFVAAVGATAGATSSAEAADYRTRIPILATVFCVALVLDGVLGYRGALGAAEGRARGFTRAAFVLTVLAGIWAAVFLLFAVLDTPAEDAVSLPQAGIVLATGLLVPLATGLAASAGRGARRAGGLLLCLYVVLTVVDYASASSDATGPSNLADSAAILTRVLGGIAAAVLVWFPPREDSRRL